MKGVVAQPPTPIAWAPGVPHMPDILCFQISLDSAEPLVCPLQIAYRQVRKVCEDTVDFRMMHQIIYELVKIGGVGR